MLRLWLAPLVCFIVWKLVRGEEIVGGIKARTWHFIWILGSMLFVVSAAMHFAAFKFNGIDFSIFDWMIHKTRLGQIMWSPSCDCNHVGIHPYLLPFLLVPLHAIWTSPWLLVVVHALTLGAGLWALAALARLMLPRLDDRGLLLIGLAYMLSGWVGSISNYGYHVEAAFVPLGLWFLYFWHRKSPWAWLMALLFLSVKEDGAIYLAAWGAGWFLAHPGDRRRSLILILIGAMTFVILTKVVQPLAWASESFRPPWAGFYGKYGQTPGQVVIGALRQPIMAVTDIFTSQIWIFVLSFGGLFFVSLPTVFALMPGVLLLGLSASPQMHGLALYYTAPLLPFAWYGFLRGLSVLADRFEPLLFRRFMAAILLLQASLGGIGVRFPKPRFAELDQVRTWRENVLEHTAPSDIVCAQSVLYPHVGYSESLRLWIPDRCPAAAKIIVIHSGLDPYPYDTREALLAAVAQDSRVIDLAADK